MVAPLPGSNVLGLHAHSLPDVGVSLASSSSNTISIGNLSGRITKDSNVTLIINKSAKVLNKDVDADYVISNPSSAKALVNELNDMYVKGGFYAVYTDDKTDTDNIATLFVYITATN